jgi:hypothetical protein
MGRHVFGCVCAALIGLAGGLVFYEVFFYVVAPCETFSTLGGIAVGLTVGVGLMFVRTDDPPGRWQLLLAFLGLPVAGALLAFTFLELMPGDSSTREPGGGWFYIAAFGVPALASWFAARRREPVACAVRLSLCTAAMTPAWAMVILTLGIVLSGGPALD